MMITITLTTLLALPALPLQEAADGRVASAPRARTEHTAEDIEVMRRLLVKEIGETSPRTAVEGGAFTVLSIYGRGGGTGNIGHSRGFHVPSMGALFTLDVALPVAEVEAPPQEEEPRGDDEWEAARREVSKSSGGGFDYEYLSGTALGKIKEAKARQFVIDPDAIDDAIEAAVRTAARHGGRIRGLERGDSITVALHLTARSQMSARTLFAAPPEGDTRKTEVAWATLPFVAISAPDVRVVIEVPLGDASAYIDDRISVPQLMDRVTIHQY